MRKLIVGQFVSLDGVVQGPGGPGEDRDGGFEHGGWVVPYVDEKLVEIMTEWVVQAGGLLLGRATYDIFAGSWPKWTDPGDTIAVTLNGLPKFVASRTLKSLAWNNSSLLGEDVVAEIQRLKQQDGGEIQVHGSGNLLQTLFKHDLVDGLRLWVMPVVLGSGKRLFEPGVAPAAFRLTETVVGGTGAVLQVYERAGPVQYGTMEVE
jgi:dihydrofolate reductase